MSKPFFSIIIPAFNAEGHIREGLESIRNQTFTDYELIVVCDSCKDGTRKIAEEYTTLVKDVEYGLDGLTRNAGIEMASGEWVLFMDDDDWFLHEYVLQQLADFVGKHDEDAVVFSYVVKDGAYQRSKPDNVQVPVWCKCWRRAFLGDDVRFSVRHYWSDCDFQNKAMRKPHKFVYWDMPLYYYNQREGNQTENYNQKKVRQFGKPYYVILADPALKQEGETKKE